MRLRHAATAGIVLFALVGLSACRSDPKYAAYVGDFKLTEDRVTQLTDMGAENAKDQITREETVTIVVVDALCQRLKAEKGFTYEEQPVPPGTPEINAITARAVACIGAMPADAVEPTEADLLEVYNNGITAGVIAPDVPIDQVREGLLAGGQLGQAIGRRNVLQQAATAADVSVNPRYSPLHMDLLRFGERTALAALFGPAPNVVVPAR